MMYLCTFRHVTEKESVTGLHVTAGTNYDERMETLLRDKGWAEADTFITSTVNKEAYDRLSEEKQQRCLMVWGVWKEKVA